MTLSKSETNLYRGQDDVPDNQFLGREVRLSRQRAAIWITRLNDAIHSGCDGCDSLVQFRDLLEDDCWLARWQREAVALSVCPTMLVDVTETLLQLCRCETDIGNIEVLEEIIQLLSEPR